MNDALELLCIWLETYQRQAQKDDAQWRELSEEAEKLMEDFYRLHRRNKVLIHSVNDLVDAYCGQMAHETHQALLLGLQMGAAVGGVRPLRWEP